MRVRTQLFDVAGNVYKVQQEGVHVFFHGVGGAIYAMVPFTNAPGYFHVIDQRGHTPRNFRGCVLKVVGDNLEVVQ